MIQEGCTVVCYFYMYFAGTKLKYSYVCTMYAIFNNVEFSSNFYSEIHSLSAIRSCNIIYLITCIE